MKIINSASNVYFMHPASSPLRQKHGNVFDGLIKSAVDPNADLEKILSDNKFVFDDIINYSNKVYDALEFSKKGVIIGTVARAFIAALGSLYFNKSKPESS